MMETIDFAGDENIGVYTRVFEDVAFVPLDAPETFVSAVEKRLGVEVVPTTIQGSSIIGSLLVGNSNGMIVSGLATSAESELLKKYGNVMFLNRSMNAAGNIILANDDFAVVHPSLPEKIAEQIAEHLDVPVIMMTIGNVPTVGMSAVATSRGVVVSAGITAQELEEIENATELPVGKGTVNMGSTHIGTGLIANGKSYMAGIRTSGYELGRIEEVLSLEL